MKKLSREEAIAVTTTLVVVFGLLFFGNTIFQSVTKTSQSQETTTTTLDKENSSTVKAGDTISVNYTGELLDGAVFDSSYDRKAPITFTVGSGQLIKGFDDGVIGMKIGEKRKLTIPPELGYGSTANGPIPANSTLVFDVELVSIQ
ncbi:MAG: FKBP-type peptidyl-prolyl cis-trans isomerase [bacterium]|nr:FKBP-type peptidyl-prolyl cis-trans isomerase [bacterium]